MPAERHSKRVYAAGTSTVDGHPRPKAGVFAVMAGMALYQNPWPTFGERSFVEHSANEVVGSVGLGDGTCGLSGSWLKGEWLYRLKDWIDRKWMCTPVACLH